MREATTRTAPSRQAPAGMVWIPGGEFRMGSDEHYPEEAPAHAVTVDGFWMDRYTVTNADFRRFAEATAYVDALAYAQWVGKALPTEAEWEFAARGGLEDATYAWGEEFTPRGRQMANTWQGEFPWQNLLSDGWERTAPVGSYPPNGYGLYDMIGNVWEWTTDWYAPHHEPRQPCCGDIDAETARNRSYDPATPNVPIPRRVIKGGSFLCAPNYCRRYRPAARMAQAVDTPACHVGLRLILRAPRAERDDQTTTPR